MIEHTPEENELIEQIRILVREEIVPVRAELDAKNEYPHKVFEKFKEAGLFASLYKEEYGGVFISALSNIIICEELSYGCLGITTAFFASKLGAMPIEFGATEKQKQKWIPPLASGEKIAAFALTEPNAGSDVPALSTVAVKKGDRYVINGTKQWISNGGEADFYTTFCLTDKSKGPRGISCLIIEKGTPGLSFGKKEDKLGIRCSATCQVIYEDCEVPEENLIGGKENQGFLHALQTLNASRPVVASCGVGLGQAALDSAIQYARERKQFGVKISSFQAIQHMLAEMAMKIEASRLMTYQAAYKIINNAKDRAKYSAMAKCMSSDYAMSIVTDALQIHGGYGYTKEYPIEKYFRDAKILQIYEGTSQIQKNEIAAGLIKEAASSKKL